MATPSMAAGLNGPDRNASVALTALFAQWGLASLAPVIVDYLKQGYSSDTVTVMLQATPQYKQRFAANDARIKGGLSALSPAEYLAAERGYHDILQKYGMPKGFYDSQNDYQKFLEKDISPAELDSRASSAAEFINRNDPETLRYFKNFYTTGDMIAFALDTNRAAPLVGKAFQASEIGGAAANSGLSIDRIAAERLAGMGIETSQAQQGFGNIGRDMPVAKQLNAIHGDNLTQSDLIAATFENDAQATTKRNRLASAERGMFGGSSGTSAQALSTNSSSG